MSITFCNYIVQSCSFSRSLNKGRESQGCFCSWLQHSGVAQWVVHSTHNRSVANSSPIKGSSCCFLEKEILLSLLSTGSFKEHIPVKLVECNNITGLMCETVVSLQGDCC